MEAINSPPLSNRIEYIYENYYTERAIEKYVYLTEEIHCFVDELGFSNDFTYYLEDFKVNALVNSYYLDVIRYKEYHFNPKKDDGSILEIDVTSEEWIKQVHSKYIHPNKVAALTTKWLLRYSPFQIHNMDDEKYKPTQDEEALILQANALFCINHLSRILNIAVKDIPLGIIKDLKYHFQYRNLDERHFFLILDRFNDFKQ